MSVWTTFAEIESEATLITDAAEQAIDNGLNYLRSTQKEDGAWGNRAYESPMAIIILASPRILQ